MISLARPARFAGFTLLELMTTLGISALLLAIAVPAFRNMTVGSQLTSQVNDLVSALNVARSEAIKRNVTISFCRTNQATATACSTSTGDWANWIVATSTGTVIRRGTVADYGGTIVVQSTLDTDTVTFSSDGLARTAGSLVTSRVIKVSTTKLSRDNLRCITVGTGSRISTTTKTGTCS
jgi:type IV fimbrial biogenesis protein FimT